MNNSYVYSFYVTQEYFLKQKFVNFFFAVSHKLMLIDINLITNCFKKL